MPTKEELEDLITNRIDTETHEMIELIKGGGINGGQTESTEKLGAMAERCGADCISGKDIL